MDLSPTNLAIVVMVVAGVMYAGVAMRRGRAEGVKKLAVGLASLRHAAAREMRNRPPGPNDALTGVTLELYDTSTRELKDQGFSNLGDQVEERDDGSPVGTTRWFVDRSGEVCGWFAAVPVGATGKHRMVMLLFSELDSGSFVTTSRGAPELGIARPPTAHRQFIAWADGVKAAADKHRSLMESIRAKGPGQYKRVGTLEEGVALLKRQRVHTNDWRAQQPAESLLEADVRNVLRARYADLGADLIAEFRATSK